MTRAGKGNRWMIQLSRPFGVIVCLLGTPMFATSYHRVTGAKGIMPFTPVIALANAYFLNGSNQEAADFCTSCTTCSGVILSRYIPCKAFSSVCFVVGFPSAK